MTDRELLEAAAKAAGIVPLRSRLDDPLFGDLLLPAHEGRGVGWNPLTDDGDALRLAVKLGLEVDCQTDPIAVGDGNIVVSAPTRGDPYAATRRAIVRAAAAIGAAAG